ncbi:MAG: RluA family pseudouridine synthase [Candidatus Dormibacteria bacterium]
MSSGELARLDVWLARERGMTRHAAQTMIAAGLVTMNGRVAKASQRVNEHDVVRVSNASTGETAAGPAVAATPPSHSPLAAGTTAVVAARGRRPPTTSPAAVSSSSAVDPLRIVYEDEWLAVVDKPAGMVVHPAAGHHDGTLVDALKARGTTWSLLGGAERAGIVHRLDRDTSGLLVVAKTEAAHRSLAEQLRLRTLGRTYWAAVHGGFRESSGTVDAPIGRSTRDRKKMAVADKGRAAVTDFAVVERLGELSVLDVTLRTGRTHQIRVHMAYIKHPIVGDAVYGRKSEPPYRPALHARQLTFVHPGDAKTRQFVSPLPDDLVALLGTLSRAR